MHPTRRTFINTRHVPGDSGFTPTPLSQTSFGTLVTETAHAVDEFSGGERIAMLELAWSAYEPSQGSFSSSYISQMQSKLQTLRNAGFQVTLGLGLHYVPSWVASTGGNLYLTNQDTVSSSTLNSYNFIFSQHMRDLAESYLARVHADLGFSNFWSIRIASGTRSELLYPEGGTPNYSYWAFDTAAQTGAGLAAGQTACPFPAWVPGGADLSISTGQVATWLDWYVTSLINTASWQMDFMDNRGFAGWYEILTPGSGMRPSAVVPTVNAYLPSGSIAGVGALWQRVYELLPNKPRSAVYCSSVADGSGGDDYSMQSDYDLSITDASMDAWSATRWQCRIAREYDMKMRGENPGYDRPASINAKYVDTSASGLMAKSFQQVIAGQFDAFYWAHSDRLWDGTLPYVNYANRITAVLNGAYPVQPSQP